VSGDGYLSAFNWILAGVRDEENEGERKHQVAAILDHLSPRVSFRDKGRLSSASIVSMYVVIGLQ
jgi:hypothetical protein